MTKRQKIAIDIFEYAEKNANLSNPENTFIYSILLNAAIILMIDDKQKDIEILNSFSILNVKLKNKIGELKYNEQLSDFLKSLNMN
jgi:hypothetical protein